MNDEQARRLSPDEIERRFQAWEGVVAVARAHQLVLARAADHHQIPLGDGCRNLNEWIGSRGDVAPETASAIVKTARYAERHRPLARALEQSEVTWDRAVAIAPLLDDADIVEWSGLDIPALRRQAARQHHLTSDDEHEAFVDRYVAIQPTLDESSRRFHGRLPGVDGVTFEKALLDRADEFHRLPGGGESTRGQRQADALVAMAQDSLDRDSDQETSSGGSAVAVLIDLDRANGTGGELGAEIAYGPRVGPTTLAELLCTGSVQVIGMAQGRPIITSDAAKAIPPAVRHAVAWRDGGCTIDGCTSRYRLQPHHIKERHHGGAHDPDNLTTLCWYHHHVAIHSQGFHIDPTSPPLRRRLIRPRAHSPPEESD